MKTLAGVYHRVSVDAHVTDAKRRGARARVCYHVASFITKEKKIKRRYEKGDFCNDDVGTTCESQWCFENNSFE